MSQTAVNSSLFNMIYVTSQAKFLIDQSSRLISSSLNNYHLDTQNSSKEPSVVAVKLREYASWDILCTSYAEYYS